MESARVNKPTDLRALPSRRQPQPVIHLCGNLTLFSSQALSRVLGAAMLTWFSISLTDFSNLVPLIIVVSLITLAALMAIPLMPRSAQTVEPVATRQKSVAAGASVVVTVAGGLVFACAFAVLQIVNNVQ
jgi:hypothetical protein